MLPPVVAAGTDVGVLSMSWFDIPKGNLLLEYFVILYWDVITINLSIQANLSLDNFFQQILQSVSHLETFSVLLCLQ